MIRLVSRTERRRDEDLARYFAFRCHVWRAQHPKEPWATLAQLLRVERPELTALKNGVNGSAAKIANFARALGPPSEDVFKQLARAWAEKYSSWKPEDPLPPRIEFTGDALVDGAEGDLAKFSDDFRAAAQAIPILLRCTPDEARQAAEAAWRASPDHQRGWLAWLPMLESELKRIKQASGERPSSRHKIAT